MKKADRRHWIWIRTAAVFAAMLAVMAGTSCSGKRDRTGIEASGTIEAIDVDLASEAAGKVLEVKVDEGTPVKAGDVLALIDHASLDIELRQAEGGADLARAQLDLLVKGARKEDIAQAEEQLSQAETDLKTAENDRRRMVELEKTGSVTTKQREDAESRCEVMKARRNAVGEALARVRKLARPEEIRAAEARLAQAEAMAALLKKRISDSTIVSPLTGTVTNRPVEPGEFVGIGTTVLTISRLDLVHVMIYVTEIELGSVRIGDAVDVSIDSMPGRKFEGKVTYISPQAEFTPKNVQTRDDRVKLVFGVKVEIPNPDGHLKPGLPADAVIRTAR